MTNPRGSANESQPEGIRNHLAPRFDSVHNGRSLASAAEKGEAGMKSDGNKEATA